MQSNATRPVMDVARRSPSLVVPRTPVRKAPDVQSLAPQHPVASQPASQRERPETKTLNQAKKQTAVQYKTSAPVGIIVMSLLVMMVLIGLAITIYLTSQI